MRKLFLFSHVCLQAGERKSHAQIRKKPSLFVLFVNLYIKEKTFTKKQYTFDLWRLRIT